ncbi:DNA-binding protein rfxank_ putative [Caligus rogercresseyi]|uniref:DNA-binding protein rfxank_ putative n=1 Tax=Caligus rogercresseyi TaxID=217165 RepID=A0A7T8KIW9_CALRO|nr:DNA-binding protein rfxank_ putative [Caligus rogercresseyi]
MRSQRPGRKRLHAPHVCSAYNHPHSVNELLLHQADLSLTNICGDTAYSLAALRKADLARAVIENHLLSLLKRHKT